MQTEEWIQALWRLPVAMTVATEHGDVGIVHAVVIDRSWHRNHRRHRTPGPSGDLDRAPGGHGSEWRGRPGAPVEGVRALVTGHEPVCEAQTGGYWWQVDPGAGFAGFNRLTLLRIDCEPMEPYTVDAVAVERARRSIGSPLGRAQLVATIEEG